MEGEATEADEARVLDGATEGDRVLRIVDVRRVEERTTEDTAALEQVPKVD